MGASGCCHSIQKLAYGSNSTGDPGAKTHHSTVSALFQACSQFRRTAKFQGVRVKDAWTLEKPEFPAQCRIQFSKPPALAEISKHNGAESWGLLFYSQASLPSLSYLLAGYGRKSYYEGFIKFLESQECLLKCLADNTHFVESSHSGGSQMLKALRKDAQRLREM